MVSLDVVIAATFPLRIPHPARALRPASVNENDSRCRDARVVGHQSSEEAAGGPTGEEHPVRSGDRPILSQILTRVARVRFLPREAGRGEGPQARRRAVLHVTLHFRRGNRQKDLKIFIPYSNLMKNKKLFIFVGICSDGRRQAYEQ